jgi:hypothetical protein
MDPLAGVAGAMVGFAGFMAFRHRRRFREIVDNLYSLKGRGSQFQYALLVTISFLMMVFGFGIVVFLIVSAIIA